MIITMMTAMARMLHPAAVTVIAVVQGLRDQRGFLGAKLRTTSNRVTKATDRVAPTGLLELPRPNTGPVITRGIPDRQEATELKHGSAACSTCDYCLLNHYRRDRNRPVSLTFTSFRAFHCCSTMAHHNGPIGHRLNRSYGKYRTHRASRRYGGDWCQRHNRSYWKYRSERCNRTNRTYG